jgi:hypothetical protein
MNPKKKDPYPVKKGTSAAPGRLAAPRDPTHNEISAIARKIWEKAGQPAGRDTAIWLEAEDRLRTGVDMVNAGDDARADTRTLLGETTDTLEGRLQGFGDQGGGRSATSL